MGHIKKIEHIPLDIHVTLDGVQAEVTSGKIQALSVPRDYGELEVEYKEQAKALEDARAEIQYLKNENHSLRLKLQTKREEQLRASEFGKQGAGIKRKKKEFD